MTMNHSFARLLQLYQAIRCIRTVLNLSIYSAQADFYVEISHCSCLAMRGHYNSFFVCQIQFINDLVLVENNKCSFGFPFYWDALYVYSRCYFVVVENNAL